MTSLKTEQVGSYMCTSLGKSLDSFPDLAWRVGLAKAPTEKAGKTGDEATKAPGTRLLPRRLYSSLHFVPRQLCCGLGQKVV